ncbi:MAG: class I SAM-dependent methyltransferase [Gammaproteobacteria bacterium]|nr:class I SAM-dependent methyltransferase [Gammaproteobacteria bacterium]
MLPIQELDLTYISIERCPLCEHNQLDEYDSGTDTLAIEINRFLSKNDAKLPPVINTRQQCKACHHIFLSPRMDPKSLKKIYEYWYGFAYNRIFDDNAHIATRLNEFRKFHMKTVNKYRNNRKTLLDIGCGSGLFIKVAAEQGWSTIGIEMDENAAKFGQEHFGANIRIGTLETALNFNEKFDVITMFDYLEHSSSPKEDITLAKKLLNPNGLLIIRVPNANSLQSKFMKKQWLAIISNHLSYFSPDVLCDYLKKNDFNIETVFAKNYQNEFNILQQRFNWALGKLINKKKINSLSNDNFISQEQVNANAFKRLLHSLLIEQIDHIGGWFNKGNNLMVVAKKNGKD